MPNYEYGCANCERIFEKTRSVADRDKPLNCPLCKNPLKRLLSLFNFSGEGEGWFGKGKKS